MNHIIFNYITTIFAVIGFVATFCIIAGYIAYKLDHLLIDINADGGE